MKNRDQRGGILMSSLVGTLLFVFAIVAIVVVIASNVRVHHENIGNGARVSIDTPMGNVKIDARDNLRPETVGIPVYPGAVREHDKNGGVTFDFDGNEGERKQFAVITASYSTSDSAEQVREFYRSRLPHWIFTHRDNDKLDIEYSEGGYKRIVAVDEQHGRTHIGIASVGEPAVN